jgi:signal transduction histidine kinase
MSKHAIPILLIEDNDEVALLIDELLKKSSSASFALTRVPSLSEGLRKLQASGVDLVLLDLSLPDSEGIETVRAVRRAARIPVVVLTGSDDDRLAFSSMDEGVQDYLVKGQVDTQTIVRAIRYALSRHQIEKELIAARDTLEEKVFERTRQLQDANSQLRAAQEQLIQAAKLQVVGELASGVAHEVKNPLAIILQGLGYLKKKVTASDAAIRDTLGYMQQAVERADAIVRGLLDFSSLSRLERTPADLNRIIKDALLLIKHRCDTEHIETICQLTDDLPLIAVDIRRIEQVLVNLFMNAADAIGTHGTLYVRTFVLSLDEAAGRYGIDAGGGAGGVVVEVEDTGSGIPEQLRQRIFDPFFTTKRAKGGTGLGLSIVRNIITMHGAYLTLAATDTGAAKVVLVFPV